MKSKLCRNTAFCEGVYRRERRYVDFYGDSEGSDRYDSLEKTDEENRRLI